MAITWNEIPNTAVIRTGQAVFQYIYCGEAVRDNVYQAALDNSNTQYYSLYLSDIECVEIGPLMYHVTITYRTIAGTMQGGQSEAGEFRWSFDTTGKTKHITHAIQNVNRYVPDGEEYVGQAGIIGEQDDGTVQGVDIPDKAFKWTETHELLIATYSFTYATTLGENTGKTNLYMFRGFPSYTVLFSGASGGQSSKDPAKLEVTYNFEVSPSATSLVVGDIGGITKTGWDHLSVRYEITEDTTAKKTTQRARQVNVDRVFLSFNFSALGIG